MNVKNLSLRFRHYLAKALYAVTARIHPPLTGGTHAPTPYPVAVGSVTVSAAQDTANLADINCRCGHITRLVSITCVRAGVVLATNPTVTLNQGSDGIVRVADTGGGYTLTADDVVTVCVTEQPFA